MCIRDSSSCSQDSEDEPNLDGVYGNAGARPGDLSERRSWEDCDDHDWGRNNWVGQAGVPEGARTWVKDMMRTGRDALASEPSSTGPSLNTRQAHAVDTVRQHDLQLQAYWDQGARTGEMHPGHGRDNWDGKDRSHPRDGTDSWCGNVQTTRANRKRCLWDRGTGAIHIQNLQR